MNNHLSIAILALVLALLFRWCFTRLPRENWQFLAILPGPKDAQGHWQGVNLTYYGVFNATAYTLACAALLVLTASAGLAPRQIAALAAAMLAVCAPASRGIARWVEKKPFTFSIGGASFLGLLILPLLLGIANRLAAGTGHPSLPPAVVLAAVSIAYTLGESVGRLACISFGCCYGKPIDALPPGLQRIFGRWHFVFFGGTKKIAYADHLAGVRVVPIQGLTAVFYALVGLTGILLYIHGAFRPAFLLTLSATQLWRFSSEFLRADHRGGGRISAYQIMALVSVAYGLILTVWLPPSDTAPRLPEILTGLHRLWHPGWLLGLQALWLASFLYTGRSRVTGARIDFHVESARI